MNQEERKAINKIRKKEKIDNLLGALTMLVMMSLNGYLLMPISITSFNFHLVLILNIVILTIFYTSFMKEAL